MSLEVLLKTSSRQNWGCRKMYLSGAQLSLLGLLLPLKVLPPRNTNPSHQTASKKSINSIPLLPSQRNWHHPFLYDSMFKLMEIPLSGIVSGLGVIFHSSMREFQTQQVDKRNTAKHHPTSYNTLPLPLHRFNLKKLFSLNT